MKISRPPHNWAVSAQQAVIIQKRMAFAVRQIPLARPVQLVAGVDAAFSRDSQHCIAGVVLWDMQKRFVVERHIAFQPLRFPYIPGLLSFREAPTVIAVLRKLQCRPDVLICDGQGIAHPRSFGIACHLGVLTDLPTIGCAKSRLIGTYQEPGLKKASRSPLMYRHEIVGAVLRTRDKVKPVFVSIGHKIDLPSSEHLILACTDGFRLPEPTRQADHLVAAAKKKS